ncbi:MAG TPA: transporter substrate-binding domain-containing protein [Myxococcota bacterium]|nr:transporter substrate-binding domain-containing protein [Myxococcota bacterium]
MTRRARAALAFALAFAFAGNAAAQLETPPGISLEAVAQKWTGDLDGMVARHMIRVLTPYSRTHYFIDRGVQRGLVYDAAMQFEKLVNAKYKTGTLKVHVVMIPTPRDQLLPSLVDGRGDIAAAGLTVTDERKKLVDFAPPTFQSVSEIAVTGPGGPALASADDLSGREVFVRKSSSYWESLSALNERFAQEGRKPLVLDPAPEALEDEDLLQMVSAGLIPIVVVDDYLANFWKKVLPAIQLHPEIALRTGADIAPAYRKDSPQLAALMNGARKNWGAGSAFLNLSIQRYLKQTKYVKSATSGEDLKRFLELVHFFQKYGDEYKLDWLMMIAQGYQESQLDPKAKSHVGAVGVMQVMPATGKELDVGDVHQTEANIHAGVKYVRFMIDEYYQDEPMTELDKTLFAFASYNCGAGRVRQLRREAGKLGLDPNVWFGNVERVAAKRIGRETVTYVRNIYEYAVAYQLAMKQLQEKKAATESVAK